MLQSLIGTKQQNCFSCLVLLNFYPIHNCKLKADCRGADWINKTIKKKRIRHGSLISLYSEIHEDGSDLVPFILETKNDPRP